MLPVTVAERFARSQFMVHHPERLGRIKPYALKVRREVLRNPTTVNAQRGADTSA